MTEVRVKTHLIITDIHSEYDVNWFGKIKNTNPLWENDKPVFVIKSDTVRVELNTFDIHELERIGKKITNPQSRKAVATEQARIYIKEIGGAETLMGIITHKRIKTFAPMYDKVGWRD